MAGMQYSFFPTDFYYPRPQSVAVERPSEAMASASRVDHVTKNLDGKEDMIFGHDKAALQWNVNSLNSMGLCCVLSVHNKRKASNPFSSHVGLRCALSVYNKEDN